MPTLGEELKQRRERRGVTLAEIAESTRIGTRFLKAIETDNFSILPGGIFTRSFIRAYAKHVGMNEDEAVGLYLQQVSGAAPEQPEVTTQAAANLAAPIEKGKPVEKAKKPPVPVQPVAKPTFQPPERSRRFEPVAFRPAPSRTSWPTIVIGGGIVVFIIIIVLALVKQLNQGTSDSGSQATSAQKDSPSKPAPETAPSTSAPSGSAPSKPAEQPSTPASVPEGQPLVVKIEAATGDSWVKYRIDDSKPTTLVLKQGQSQDLPPAQVQVTLNYGNRLTLKLKINNRDANFPPDTPKFASQVVISRENFQTFFQ